MLLKPTVFILFTVVSISVFVPSTTTQGETPPLGIRLVRRFESPFTGGKGGGNSYLLPGMPPDGPCLAVSWATSYENCTVAFYDADLKQVATWREPVADGDKVMCLTAGDLDNDGENEILLTVRKQAPGVYALHWSRAEKKLETLWSFLDVKQGPFYRGVEVGNFTEHEGREVCFGGDGTGLYLLEGRGKLIRHTDRPAGTIQRIDVCDDDRDGYDEIIISIGRSPGRVVYARWKPDTAELRTIWSANVTPEGLGGDNCYEALYHPRGHPGAAVPSP